MKKKPSVSLILGGGPKDDEAGEGDMNEDSYSEEQTEMANELIDAVKAGEPDAVLKAIHGIYLSYSMGSDSGEAGGY